MSRRTLLAALLSAALIYAFAVVAQHGADAARVQDLDEELLYLPNKTLLKHFTAGMNGIVADMIWLECVSYVAKESKGGRNFEWLNQMANTVVDLDPHFVDAYRFGGMFLAALKADDDAGLDLLDRGIVRNPHAWELPYEAGMIYLLNRRDQPGSKRMAAHYLGMAAVNGDAPPLIRELAAKLQGEYDLNEVEREMWTGLLDSDDKLLRELAETKLKELQTREFCAELNRRMEAYREQTGAMPPDLAALGMKGSGDPLGGEYFIGEDGMVYSTTLLDRAVEDALKRIDAALQAFREKNGINPALLDMAPDVPPHPYPGGRWEYERMEGKVTSVLPER